MCRRVEKHIKELLVFVAHPEVPPDNNAAERSLRPQVISRKISGGTRSERGTGTKMALASIFGTWRAQGLNPLTSCQQLLASPQIRTVTDTQLRDRTKARIPGDAGASPVRLVFRNL